MKFDWRARVLRATLFAVGPISDADYVALWNSVAGEAYELEENKPNSGMRRRFLALTDVLGLELVSQLGRCDIVLNPISNKEIVFEIGEVEASLKQLVELLRRSINACAFPLIRLAVAGEAWIPEKSRDASYAVLGKLLKSVKVDAKNSKELIYHINKPVFSKVDRSLEINRITRWASLLLSQTVMANTGAGPMVQSEPRGVDYCHLVFDISTNAERTSVLTAPMLEGLVSEFSEIILDILENGEPA